MKYLVPIIAMFLLILCQCQNATQNQLVDTNYLVKVIYLVPADRYARLAYNNGIIRCINSIRGFYKTQMAGKTFHVSPEIVKVVKSTHNASWFNENVMGTNPDYYFYYNAYADTQALLGTEFNTEKYTFLVYVDAYGKTGAGALGFTAMPENDLLGLIGRMPQPISRWYGGAGHELGHAFGLPHPQGQQEIAIMWTGYLRYPNCTLLPNDKDILSRSNFIY